VRGELKTAPEEARGRRGVGLAALDPTPPPYGRLWAVDVLIAAVALVYALLSLLWPATGSYMVGGRGFLRGQVNAALFVLLACGVLTLPRLVGPGAPRFFRFARLYYPQALIAPFFFEGIILSNLIDAGHAKDALIAALDGALFGFQPSVAFQAAFSGNFAFNELLFSAYFLYFVELTLMPWIPFFRRREREAAAQVFIMMLLCLCLDLWYLVFWVQGPKYWIPELVQAGYTQFKGGLFVGFYRQVAEGITLSGAAFPSTHVAASVLLCFLGWRSDRRSLFVTLPLALLIAFSTVYLYAHYASDVLASLFLAFPLGAVLLRHLPGLEGRLTALLARPQTRAARQVAGLDKDKDREGNLA